MILPLALWLGCLLSSRSRWRVAITSSKQMATESSRRERSVWLPSTIQLIQLCAFNDRPPFHGFRLDHGGKFLRAARDRLEAHRCHAAPDLGQRHDPDDVAMPTIDNVGRRPGGKHHALPERRFL